MFAAILFRNIIIWIGFMMVYRVSAQSPENAIVELGGQAIFNCTTSNVGLTLWALSSDGSTISLPIAVGCIVQPGIPSNYRTESGIDYCNLIVSSITGQQAGVYTCTDALKPAIYRALLTVVETPAKAETNITTDVVDGEFVGLQCSMKYNGSVAPASTLRPIMHWTDINGQNVSSSYDPSNPNEAVSTATVAVGRQSELQFTCHVYFQLNVNSSNSADYASNTPTNKYNSKTSPIVAYYAVDGPFITESPIKISVTNGNCLISELTCSSSGNPPPSYQWFDLTDNDTVLTSDAVYRYAENDRMYECRASNFYRGNTHVVSEQFMAAPNGDVSPCKFPRGQANITSESCVDSICTCKSTTERISIICQVDAYPEPDYRWQCNGSTVVGWGSVIDIPDDGNYTCTAISRIDGTDVVYNASDEIIANACDAKIKDDITQLIPLIVVVSLVGANVVAMVIFIAYYAWDGDKKNKGRSNKQKVNSECPVIEKMLPCINASSASALNKCFGIFLFILMAVLIGMIAFPVIMILANCNSKEEKYRTEETDPEPEDRSRVTDQRKSTPQSPNGIYMNASSAGLGPKESGQKEVQRGHHKNQQNLQPTSASSSQGTNQLRLAPTAASSQQTYHSSGSESQEHATKIPSPPIPPKPAPKAEGTVYADPAALFAQKKLSPPQQLIEDGAETQYASLNYV